MKKIFIILITVILFTGCERFEELNTNENEPENVSGDFVLPTAIFNLANFTVNQSIELGDIMSQYTATYEQRGFDEFDWTGSNRFWVLYDVLQDVQVVEHHGLDSELPNYEAVALILKTYLFSLITDAYGDVPYTEANQALEGNFAPVYDTQESIYRDLLETLGRANSIIDETGTISGDILFNGDMTSWKRFANSLRVRLLMRMSNVASVGTQLQEIIDNPDTYPVFENTGQDAVYRYTGSLPNISPYTAGVGREYSYFLGVPTTHFVRELSDNNDPRIEEWLGRNADAGIYVGVEPGLNLSDVGRPNEFASKDTSFFQVPDKITANFMTYSELNFLWSEAAQRNLISGEAADFFYETAVAASFMQWGVGIPDDFLVTHAPFSEENLYVQKWLALYHNGTEAWFDWKRTGQPSFIQAGPGTRNGGLVPVRLMYPPLEQSINISNYNEAANRIGGDNVNSRIWWDQP